MFFDLGSSFLLRLYNTYIFIIFLKNGYFDYFE